MHWLEDEEEGWSLYAVSMYDFFNDNPIEQLWPVWAESFDNAITTYQVLLIFREQMRKDI